MSVEGKNDTSEKNSDQDSDLANMLGLFGFKSLDELTLEKLNSRRKKMLHLFHPDEKDGDPEFTQRINDAYEKLKEYCK